jgi:type IV secretion system T-DNA border endonuclease VirD2
VSAAYRQLAFVAARTDVREVALRMAEAAKALDEGRPILPRREAIVPSAGAGAANAAMRTWAGFEKHLEDWTQRMRGKMRELSPEGQAELRPEFNDITARALDILGDKRGAERAREAPKSALYRSALSATKPILDGAETAFSTARAKWLKDGLAKEAGAFGLDGAAIAGRIGAGASSAFEEREWIEADIASVAVAKGLDLCRETDRSAAAGIVDRFYEHARNMIDEARGLAMETHVAGLRRTLANMAKMAERHGFVHFETEADALGLVDHMKARYGENIVKDLAQGKTNALARDFANAGERAEIATAVTLAAVDHEAFGLGSREADAAYVRLTARRGDDNRPSRDKDRER